MKKTTVKFTTYVYFLVALIATTFLFFLNFNNLNSAFATHATKNLKTKEPGVLVCATNATLKPFEFLNENNEIVGFDIDLINEIAKRLGLKPIIKDMQFEAIVGAVNSGQADIGIAAMTKTPEREQAVSFSVPYYISNQVVLTRKDQKFENEDDFNNKTIAVQNGTISQSTIEDLINKKHKRRSV